MGQEAEKFIEEKRAALRALVENKVNRYTLLLSTSWDAVRIPLLKAVQSRAPRVRRMALEVLGNVDCLLARDMVQDTPARLDTEVVLRFVGAWNAAAPSVLDYRPHELPPDLIYESVITPENPARARALLEALAGIAGCTVEHIEPHDCLRAAREVAPALRKKLLEEAHDYVMETYGGKRDVQREV